MPLPRSPVGWQSPMSANSNTPKIRPILSMPISTNQPANSSLKCNTLKRLMCLHEYRLQTIECG
jgi:hypothetical protein